MKPIILIFLVLATGSLHSQTTLAGTYNTGTDNSRVEITEVDGVFTGTIISSDNENVRIGTQLLKDLQLAENGWKGKLYAPKRDEWYDALLEVEGNVLEITIGSGFLSKTVEWTRE